ncbi:TAXI family TRAP transporter solute-binding subunit [bacterium]|nr:TAXI family TRAP transporter solute-binding subunit [bacterium]
MRDFLRVYGVLIAVVLIALLVAMRFMAPAPPKSIVFAGGAEGGAYAANADAYSTRLKEQGVAVEVLTSEGSVANLDLLKSGRADVGIVQTGLADDLGAEGLRSLGAIYFEPMWVFLRSDLGVGDLSDLAGLKIAIGPEGAGGRVLATSLLEEAGVGSTTYEPVPLAGAQAAEALERGDIDAAVIVSGPSADWVRRLIADPAIRLMPMSRGRAIVRRHPHLDEVTLFAGVVDLADDLPREDVVLIAPSAQLVVREALHPALQALLIETAFGVNGGGTLLSDPGRFPDPKLVDIPLSDEAERYYQNGPTFLRRIFPFAVANFLERAWVLAIPLLTLLFPLVRAAPPLYRWRIRRKIYVWYRDLRALETEGRAATTPAERNAVREKLAELQGETGEVEVPLSYTDDLYRLRAHISFVAALVDKLAAENKHARV